MSYENPQQPEGINVSDEHPLRDFAWMLAMLLLIVVVSVLVLSWTAQWLAGYVPFEREQQLANLFSEQWAVSEDSEPNEQSQQRQVYLTGLAARLSAQMDLPEGMVITVHYSDDETVNAFATLGGHVLMYRGLLDKLPHENALAMVLAHEIAHVKLRHPIVALSRGLTVSIAMQTIFGVTDNAALTQLVQWLGTTSTLSFSRAQELAADAEAARAVQALYGHLNGADDLFVVLQKATGGNGMLQPPEFINTHPNIEDRIDRLRSLDAAAGATGPFTDLPWQAVPQLL